MSDKKRRWFQIHLSTAMVLTIVASWLLWANVVDREIYTYHSGFEGIVRNSGLHGWPFLFQSRAWPSVKVRTSEFVYDWFNLAGNIFVACLILSMIAFSCELFARRKILRESLAESFRSTKAPGDLSDD